jgi:hypothetical protein
VGVGKLRVFLLVGVMLMRFVSLPLLILVGVLSLMDFLAYNLGCLMDWKEFDGVFLWLLMELWVGVVEIWWMGVFEL